MLVDGISAEPGCTLPQKALPTDVVMAISDFVDSISANPGTACPNSGTSQCLPVATRSMRNIPVGPTSEEELTIPEEPMQIDQPDEPSNSMLADEPIFPLHPIPTWIQPIMSYLIHGMLPEEETLARKIQRKSKSYTIINNEAYQRSVTGVLQRCVEPSVGQEILRDIHQGECGHHISSRALVAKAFRHGFYWPTALEDAEDIVRKCNGCQRFSKQIHMPQSALKTIPITWPFAIWCLDMVGPFRPA